MAARMMRPKREGKFHAGARKPLRPAGRSGQGLAMAGQMARDRVVGSLDAERDVLTGLLDGVAEELESAAAHLNAKLSRPLLRAGGEMIERASMRLKEESAGELLGVAEDALKKHPAMLIAGLAGVGAITARIILARSQ